MLSLLIWIAVFLLALVILIKSADYFTGSAEKVGLFLGMSPFFVGVTIVALGTSIPELATSIVSVLNNSPEIVIGNVIGSNIANILLVLGFALLFSKNIFLKPRYDHYDKPFFILSAILLIVFSYNKQIDLWEAGIMILAYFVYIGASYFDIHQHEEEKDKKKESLGWKPIGILIASAIGIYIGAEFVIRSVVELSSMLSIGKDIVAAGAVAFGTSMPEMTVSLTAFKKKKHDIALGNVLGSNIFNILIVAGVAGLFTRLPFTDMMSISGLLIMALATMMFLAIVRDRKVSRWEGALSLAVYLFFILKIFNVF